MPLRLSILDQSSIIQRERATAVIGTPGQVKERLLEIRETFDPPHPRPLPLKGVLKRVPPQAGRDGVKNRDS